MTRRMPVSLKAVKVGYDGRFGSIGGKRNGRLCGKELGIILGTGRNGCSISLDEAISPGL
jgi:hypothetical protein